MTDNDKIPTCSELWEGHWEDDRYEEVDEEADPSWRHGCYMTTVLKDLWTGRFWQVSWQRSGDGETNTWREGYADVCEVWPLIVTKTIYTHKKPE
jgi:hypothetical protein